MASEYTIRFYRSQFWADRFKQAGIVKPPGMVCSPIRYRKKQDAQNTADHVNREEPERPCTLITLSIGLADRDPAD